MIGVLATLVLLASVTQPRVGDMLHLTTARNDSTLFDVEGYYFPKETLEWNDGFGLFSFSVMQFDFSSQDEQGRTKYVEEATLALTKKHPDTVVYEAQTVLLSPDTLDLVFRNTPIGEVRIAGVFLDKSGRLAANPHLVPGETPAVRAQVTVTKGGRVVDSRRVVFTYWEGD